MSRKSNTEQRRAEIVEAMLSVMASQGYEKATIQAIAEQAQLSPGLIHYHFKNKEEILLALVSAIADVGHARYLQLAAKAADARQGLQAYIDGRLAMGKGANADAVAAWVVIGTEALSQPIVRQAYQSVIRRELDLAQSLIEACLLEQGKRLTQAPNFAAILLTFAEGAFQLASAAPASMPKGYAAPAAYAIMEKLIDAAPGAEKTARKPRSK